MPRISSSSLRAFAGRYVIALFLALALTATGVAAVNREINHRIVAIKRVPVDVAKAPPDGANYLLIGSDTRAFVNSQGDVDAFGDPTVESGKNSDTLMVAHIEPGAQHAQVVSFPRDLMVEIPGQPGSKVRINTFFGNGGAQAVIDALKWNFNIDIHHYVEVDFKAFREIVNSVGSVTVNFPHPARDEKVGLDVPQAGCVALDGDRALQYVRSRFLEYYVDGKWQNASIRSDLDRIVRQQEFIRTLVGLAINQSLSDPFVAIDIADNALGYLKLDVGVGRDQVNELIKAFRHVDVNDPNAVQFETFPTIPDPANPGITLVAGPDAQGVIDRLNTFGNKEPPPVTVTPQQVKVKVTHQVGEDVAVANGLTEQLREQGFSTSTGTFDVKNKATAPLIRYSDIAAANLVSTYLRDAGYFPDPTVAKGHVIVVIGSEPITLTVPTTTTTLPGTIAPATTAAPTIASTTTTLPPACS
ncbi:MAG: LCP family protein [Acidimicrobiia bacterium]